jgi:hypothetical protein
MFLRLLFAIKEVPRATEKEDFIFLYGFYCFYHYGLLFARECM